MRVLLLVTIILIHAACNNTGSNSEEKNLDHEATAMPPTNSNWQLVKRFTFEDCTPYGISNFDRNIVVSDTRGNRIVFFDTLDHSIFLDLERARPGFIKIRRSTLLTPSMKMDSIYAFKGKGFMALENFAPMNHPTGVDGYRIDHWAFVDNGNNRVLFQNALKGIQHIFGKAKGSDFRLSDPQNVLIIDDLIYVVDSGNRRIQIFGEDGQFHGSINNGDNWIYPTGISNEVDTLYVSDAEANRIDLFTIQGKYLESITTGIDGPTDLNYYQGKLFVANNNDKTISIFKEVD
ncbi:MAG: hypothetical protein HKN09_10990 [Saprospiraceae bacterium]|nr:hypothetical protein [Saprospiraceae bacterium]